MIATFFLGASAAFMLVAVTLEEVTPRKLLRFASLCGLCAAFSAGL